MAERGERTVLEPQVARHTVALAADQIAKPSTEKPSSGRHLETGPSVPLGLARDAETTGRFVMGRSSLPRLASQL